MVSIRTIDEKYIHRESDKNEKGIILKKLDHTKFLRNWRSYSVVSVVYVSTNIFLLSFLYFLLHNGFLFLINTIIQ